MGRSNQGKTKLKDDRATIQRRLKEIFKNNSGSNGAHNLKRGKTTAFYKRGKYDNLLCNIENLECPQRNLEEIIQNYVRPYLQVKSVDASLNQKLLKDAVIQSFKDVFENRFQLELQNDDIAISSHVEGSLCHFQFNLHNYHVATVKHAKFIAGCICDSMDPIYSEFVLRDIYKKNQCLDLVGNTTSQYRLKRDNEDVSYSQHVLTNVLDTSKLIEMADPESLPLCSVKNDQVDQETIELIKQLAIEAHASTDTQNYRFDKGFYIFNYSNREEPCFTDKKSCHATTGFAIFVEDNVIKISCLHACCVDASDQKIVKSLRCFPNDFCPFKVIDMHHTNGNKGLATIIGHIFTDKIFQVQKTFYLQNNGVYNSQKMNDIIGIVADIVPTILQKYIDSHSDNSSLCESVENCLKFKEKLNSLNLSVIINQARLTSKTFEEDMNNHSYFLAARNGLIDLNTGTLHNFEARHYIITQTLNVDFDPNANTQSIENFVFEILGGNKENYDYFRWLLGYILQGKPKRKILVFLYGPKGNNGKSILLKLLRKVLGCYSVTLQPSVFQKQNDGANPQILRTKNARLGILYDICKKMEFHTGTTLSLTGGCDEFAARGLYSAITETFTPTFVPVICSNEYLSLDKNHDALINRMVIVTFPIEFVDNPDPNNEFQRKRNNNLEDELSTVENQQGLLNYLVKCSQYYHEIGDNMSPTQSMKNQVTHFKAAREDGGINIDF